MTSTVLVATSPPFVFQVDGGPLREAVGFSISSTLGPLMSVDVRLPDRTVEQYRDVYVGRLDGDRPQRCRLCGRGGD
jgi:hypothetical protein